MAAIKHRCNTTGGGWTLDTLQEHWEVVDTLHEKFQEERDRRYTEVNMEREKALRMKEEADQKALDLAREIQKYKDEKANELREQISSERGLYATKDDLVAAQREIVATISPLTAYVSGQGGANKQVDSTWIRFVAVGSIIYSFIATAGVLVTLFTVLRH